MNEKTLKVRNITMDGERYVLVPRKAWEAFQRGGQPRRTPPKLPDGNYTIEHVRLSLAGKIVSRRNAAGLSQAELARRAGVRVETISRLENGLHMPGAKTFEKIDRALSRMRVGKAA